MRPLDKSRSTFDNLKTVDMSDSRCWKGRTEHHPEEIAEEWKQHFQAIQLGKIIVPEEFWQDILPLDTDAT